MRRFKFRKIKKKEKINCDGFKGKIIDLEKFLKL